MTVVPPVKSIAPFEGTSDTWVRPGLEHLGVCLVLFPRTKQGSLAFSLALSVTFPHNILVLF